MLYKCLSCQRSIAPHFSWVEICSFSIGKRELLPPLSSWLCQECEQDHRLIGERCQCCSRLVEELESRYVEKRKGKALCYDCRRWIEWEEQQGIGPILNYNRSAMGYNEHTQPLIERYKFKGDQSMKFFFASFLWQQMKEDEGTKEDLEDLSAAAHVDLILPIPVSEQRLQERGFNQSALMAQLLAERSGIAYQEGLLYKTETEAKQSKKGRTERLTDLLTTFRLDDRAKEYVQQKRVLLVDDIYTTGATLYAAAYLLKKEAGAAFICAYTAVRA